MVQPETHSCVPNCKSGYQRSQEEWKLCAINERRRLIIDSWKHAPDLDQATRCMSNDETVAFHAEDKEFNPSDSTTVTAHKTTVICSSDASFTRPIQTRSQLSGRLTMFHVEISTAEGHLCVNKKQCQTDGYSDKAWRGCSHVGVLSLFSTRAQPLRNTPAHSLNGWPLLSL